MITLSEARALLVDHGIAEQVGRKKDGTLIARKGYFYRNGDDCIKFANQVIEKCERAGLNIHVIDSGDNWTAFKGGLPLQRQSHFWVNFS